MNHELRFEVLATIVGFMNYEGGTLLIGVQNNHSVVGLEGDLNTTGRSKNLNQFQVVLYNLISDRIGAKFTPFIKIRFEKIESKDICVVEVKRSPEPTFLNTLEGRLSVKKFYVRQGNTTRSLDVEQTTHYIRLNWK